MGEVIWRSPEKRFLVLEKELFIEPTLGGAVNPYETEPTVVSRYDNKEPAIRVAEDLTRNNPNRVYNVVEL